MEKIVERTVLEKTVLLPFVGGVLIGKFTNLFIATMAVGALTYYCEPSFYSVENINAVRETLVSFLNSNITQNILN